MSTKRELLDNPNSCLNKARDDEELFVLRGQDQLAPHIVRYWAFLASGGTPVSLGGHKPYFRNVGVENKVHDAHWVAERMEKTPNRKLPD